MSTRRTYARLLSLPIGHPMSAIRRGLTTIP